MLRLSSYSRVRKSSKAHPHKFMYQSSPMTDGSSSIARSHFEHAGSRCFSKTSVKASPHSSRRSHFIRPWREWALTMGRARMSIRSDVEYPRPNRGLDYQMGADGSTTGLAWGRESTG